MLFRREVPEKVRELESYTLSYNGEKYRARILTTQEDELLYDLEIPELTVIESRVTERLMLGLELELSELGGVNPERVQKALEQVRNLGEIAILTADENITDVFIYQSGRVSVVHLHYGELSTTLRLASAEQFATQLRLLTNRQFDYSQPLLSYFHKRFRVSATGYSATPSQKLDVAIRIWHSRPLTIVDLLRFGSMTPEIASLLTLIANLGCAVIIAGDRGGGKSTLLQVMLSLIPKNARKVCILTEREIHEYYYEKDYSIVDFKVHLGEDYTQEGVPLERAVKQALIHGSSSYIIYNEIKEREEARLFFTTCAVAGLSSILTTMHAESPEGILQRLALDFQLPKEALRNINYILMAQAVQRKFDKRLHRRVTSITEIRSFREDPLKEGALNDLFSFDVRRFEWDFSIEEIAKTEVLRKKLNARGISREEFFELFSRFRELFLSMKDSGRDYEPLEITRQVTKVLREFSEEK